MNELIVASVLCDHCGREIPLGLPLVWLSSRFSKLAKIGLTTGFVLLTVIFPIVLVWYWCDAAMRPLVEVFAR